MKIEELHQIFQESHGICTDTRKLESNTIFFALKGANFNGNEFAQQALEAGCLLAVVDEKEHVVSDKCVLVDSVLKTLQKLAQFHRRQFDIPVIGITGSNGKTTSKELIGAVLSQKYNVLMTEGNLNNHLGVPFTLLRLKPDDEIAIIEMGANKPGDIQELVEIAEPNCGIITNIGAAHIEGFGSLEGVIQTKTEMYRFIEQHNGTVIYNVDDEILQEHLGSIDTTFTYGDDGEVSGELIKLNPFVNFKWSYGEYQSPELSSNLVGRYNFVNFLLAAAVGCYYEVAPEQINEALKNYVPSNNRSQVTRTDRNTLIVDCYNANATSMMAALESFNEIEHPKKFAILGDMLELGDISEEEHQKIHDYLLAHHIYAVLVGNEFSSIDSEYDTYKDVAAVTEDLDLNAVKDSLILLKGSRGIKLEQLIEEL